MTTTSSNSKSIFITGAASGIGRATAQLFAARGWTCGLADLNQAGLAETAALLPAGKAVVLPMDVCDRTQFASALEAFAARHNGGIDVVFNNAGIAQGGPFAEIPLSAHDRLIDINFKGVVNGAYLALPYLQKTGGCLLNTGSASGIYGASGLAIYAATKFAVRGLTESLDIEFAPLGVRVRSLMPSFIDTPLLDGSVANTNRSIRETVQRARLEFTPLEQVAEAAWSAVHGNKVHVLVGKTAHRLAFWARFAPGTLAKTFKKRAAAAQSRPSPAGQASAP
jgi:NAD(P)-dependent dehydrogenase (short-subunit alcohol dehydrogenase family)